MLAQKILRFNAGLTLDDRLLPLGVKHLNPFQGPQSANIKRITKAFYEKYYSDPAPRHFMIGINPGRLGAGLTGIPFTDTRRLQEICNIDPGPIKSHEPSSVFIYEVIAAMGGPAAFFSKIYLGAVCPLGFVQETIAGKIKNYNYYDRADLKQSVRPFIIQSLQKQLSWGLRADQVFCLGTGQNYKFLSALNIEMKLFKSIVPLEHPRYIMQYQAKKKNKFIKKYLAALP